MVATNRRAPADVLMIVANDAAWGVRARVAANPATPPALLRALAADEHWYVRMKAAKHPKTPPGILLRLLDDPHRDVRTATRIAASQHSRPVRFSEFSWWWGGLKTHWRRK